MLVSEAFEEKIGLLYNIAMAKKNEAIDMLVQEEVHGKVKGSKKKSLKKAKERAAATTPPEVQGNFPFAKHLTETVKASMSEALLRIMMRDEDKVKDRGDASAPRKSPKEDTSSSSNSFDKSLKKKKRSLVPCYVDPVTFRLVVGTKDKMLSVGGSFVNKFGESSMSRARRNPSSSPSSKQQRYFRNTANMMGFLPHEVNIRFCKPTRQLIISGARQKRGNENARQVRETIEIPADVQVQRITVLRTNRGSLIFEEVDEEVHEEV